MVQLVVGVKRSCILFVSFALRLFTPYTAYFDILVSLTTLPLIEGIVFEIYTQMFIPRFPFFCPCLSAACIVDNLPCCFFFTLRVRRAGFIQQQKEFTHFSVSMKYFSLEYSLVRDLVYYSFMQSLLFLLCRIQGITLQCLRQSHITAISPPCPSASATQHRILS